MQFDHRRLSRADLSVWPTRYALSATGFLEVCLAHLEPLCCLGRGQVEVGLEAFFCERHCFFLHREVVGSIGSAVAMRLRVRPDCLVDGLASR